jgi:Effector Associated Constant Component 1
MSASTAGQSLQLIATADIPETKLDALTRDLARDLSNNRGVRAKLSEAPAGQGERGAASKIGEIVVDFIGGTGLKAAGEVAATLAEVLKAYLLREKTLKIRIVLPDGTKVSLDAKNISVGSIETVVRALGRTA